MKRPDYLLPEEAQKITNKLIDAETAATRSIEDSVNREKRTISALLCAACFCNTVLNSHDPIPAQMVASEVLLMLSSAIKGMGWRRIFQLEGYEDE